ncbi:MAG: sensor histidine kinase [Candidatus Pristimantibacillus lignocellulolyticus]|uniref:histidine kinase n=1 Tax=Candidatus Pristimantibacillus lignocellulolyticus TaxID=2994561 RepID=A0A9J6Z904_9BACL|nr:MAG: sensor histidine kinase [Candidatus Pristimantibacillus lignocellulolyticus]
MKNSEELPNEEKKIRSRVLLETFIWLLIIGSFLLIIMQGAGILHIMRLQGTWSIIGLGLLGVGLAGSAAYQYFINSRLKASMRKILAQRKSYSPITLIGSEDQDTGVEQTEEDSLREEQVRFTAVIEERQRLARELHDAVSQQLFAISMTATAVSRTIERDWERAKRQVQLIEEMASVAQSEMRALLLHLRPVHLDGKSLGLALTALVNELQQKIPMEIELVVDTTIVMRVEIEDHLFRIAQEALSNALRHSKAEYMLVKLYKLDHDVHMIIQDKGVGFEMGTRKQGSYGLLTMEERVIELGGQFRLSSDVGEGTTVFVSIPYEPPIVTNVSKG